MNKFALDCLGQVNKFAKEKESKAIKPRSRGYTIFLVLYMGLISQMDQYLSLIEGPAVPLIILEFGIERSEFAFWQGIFGFLTLSVIFLAWFSDAFGRKRGIIVLILLMGLPILGILFFSFNLLLFLIFYAIIITGTLSNMWELPIVEDAKPKKRGTYGGIAYLIGLIPLYALLGTDIAESWGWRWAYGIMFFYMLGLLMLSFFFKETQIWNKTQEEKGHEFLQFKKAIKSLSKKDIKYVALSTIIYTIWTISFKMGATWIVEYYTVVIGLSYESFYPLYLIAGIMTMFGALAAGILLDKVGRNFTLAAGCIGSAIGFIFLGLTAFPLFMWFVYFFMPGVLTWIMIYFSEIFPTEVRSTAQGISVTGSRFGYVIGPLISAALLVVFEDMVGFWIVAGLFMLIPLAALILKPYETRGQSLDEIQTKRD
ncbi:MAG: MFS transporter [Promethearchaeia archaeon]